MSVTTWTHVPSGGYENDKRKGIEKGIISETLPPCNTALLLVFQQESWHETQHSCLFHYIKIPHYHITLNPSHWMTSLIQRHVMSWWDAWGLEEQRGCCGSKSFYCSKHMLLNDDNDDNEETFGEYIGVGTPGIRHSRNSICIAEFQCSYSLQLLLGNHNIFLLHTSMYLPLHSL